MRVRISRERVWWTLDNEDKPSYSYFTNFVENMSEEVDIRVNFKTYENVNIVASTDDITYVMIEHNDTTYYYFTDGIENILPNGYTYRLKLDIYITYTLPFILQLVADGVPTKVLRTHLKDDTYLQYLDKLLDNVPKSYEEIKYQFSNKFKVEALNNGYLIYYDIITDIYTRWTDNGYATTKGTYGVWIGNDLLEYTTSGLTKYHVFNDCSGMDFSGTVTPSGYLLVPEYIYQTSSVKLMIRTEHTNYKWVTEGINVPGLATTSYFVNTLSNINKFITDNNYANKYVGTFYLPSFLVMLLTSGLLAGAKVGNELLLGIGLRQNEISIPSYEIYQLPNISELKLNSTEIGDIYLLNFFKVRYFDNELNVPLMNENGVIDLSGYFTFTDTGTILKKYKLLPLNNSIFKLPYKLVSVKDDYQRYVQANRNTTDTSYSIAKQNAFINGVSSIFGAASSIATGGSIGAGIGNVASSIAGGFVSLSQKRQTLQAMYKDARNTLGYQVHYSTDIDNSFTLYKYRKGIDAFKEGVEVSVPSTEYLKQLNNTLYLYGYYVPKLINFRDVYNVDFNGFRYILLDDLYLEHLLPVYISKKVPKKYYLNIIDDLAGGVRIWDKIPEYKI